MISVKFNSIKIDIISDEIPKIIPAINGENLTIKASFKPLKPNADYNMNILLLII